MKKTDDPKTITISMLKGYGPFSNREKQSAITTAVCNALVSNRRGTPGEVIKGLNTGVRNVLKDCKSEDWNHRDGAIFGSR